MILLQQLFGLFREGGPVAGAVLNDDLDLASENAPGGVDLIDGQLFGFNRTCLADGHRARGGMKLSDGDRVVSYSQTGGEIRRPQAAGKKTGQCH